MTTSEYLSKLSHVEKLACSSKWSRLFNNPLKYISAIFFKEFIYPRSKKEKLKRTRVFFDRDMLVALPASTDIYLTGGKSHDSEIRLARYLIRNLYKGQSFLDIGAHYGYFTLLASGLVGEKGHVLAFEPSTTSFNILKDNCKAGNIQVSREAVSDKDGQISFYEFPNLYSEYNSTSVDQFSSESWIAQYKPEKVTVNARTIDSIAAANDFHPDIIKIDVEGAEHKVIAGAKKTLTQSPQVVMEYLSSERSNEAHRQAYEMLKASGYIPHIINKDGNTEPVDEIEAYLAAQKTDSDNIVFKKLQ